MAFTTKVTCFPKFPPELREAIWSLAIEPEIISVLVRRRAIESPAKAQQTCNQPSPEEQFTFKYRAGGVRVNLEGDTIPYNSLRGTNQESRAAYFKTKTAHIHPFKRGDKIWFDPDRDIIHFSNVSSLFAHHLRQRLRVPLPFLNGLQYIKKLAFDGGSVSPDDETIQDLGEDFMDIFRINVLKIATGWIAAEEAYKYDEKWKAAVATEEKRLEEEMKNIRRSGALGRVNGGVISKDAKTLRLPLKLEDLAQ